MCLQSQSTLRFPLHAPVSPFPTGGFQNLAHIHLKVNVDRTAFEGYWGKDATFVKLREENNKAPPIASG
jgi:hypothetical protein